MKYIIFKNNNYEVAESIPSDYSGTVIEMTNYPEGMWIGRAGSINICADEITIRNV